ncbi:MAG: surface-adhesin E family protein [Thermodesulfobacteriota bacterium]
MKLVITLALIMSATTLSMAETWEKVGESNSKFEGIVSNVGKQAAVKQKDVIEAFQNSDYEVYIDTDSIKVTRDSEKSAQVKAVFSQEHDLRQTGKKFKYVLADIAFNCSQDAIWFINGGVYDNDGNLLRDAQTVYVPVVPSKLSKNSLERFMWEKVCLR